MNEFSEFKPVDRSRAYTWHGSQASSEDVRGPTTNFVQMYASVDSAGNSLGPAGKKPWSRRNAWGSMSYADLIGSAIESTVDKRMTLSQIYDWMIQNVPYFHDKGSGSSSTGWKNSIRHNLSLHRRFKRVPNEDSGKSSWWMINDAPDHCPPTRKRTVSVGKFDDKNPTTMPAPPLAKTSHIVTSTEAVKMSSQVSTDETWLQAVLPLSSYSGGTVCIPQFNQSKWSHSSSKPDPFIAADLDPGAAPPAPPLAKITHISSPTETLKSASQVGSSSSTPWSQTVLPLRWSQQPSTKTDPFFVADLDPAFANPNYPASSSSSVTQLAPISELLPPQQFTSYDLHVVEIPTPPSYGDQSSSSFSGTNLTALSSVPMLEMYADAGPAADPPSSSPVLYSTPAGMQGQQFTPGWSMLRQMLSQSHHENALMHGVASDIRPNLQDSLSAEYQPAGDNRLRPVTTGQNFTYITSPPDGETSDVIYFQLATSADEMAAIEQPSSDDTEGGSQLQPLSFAIPYTEVSAATDAVAPKVIKSENNNESVVDEKSV